MSMSRAHILLTQEQHQQLRELAELENRSISDVTRDLLELAFQERKLHKEARLAQLQKAREVAAQVLAGRNGVQIDLDLVALLNEEREERVNDLGRN